MFFGTSFCQLKPSRTVPILALAIPPIVPDNEIITTVVALGPAKVAVWRAVPSLATIGPDLQGVTILAVYLVTRHSTCVAPSCVTHKGPIVNNPSGLELRPTGRQVYLTNIVKTAKG